MHDVFCIIRNWAAVMPSRRPLSFSGKLRDGVSPILYKDALALGVSRFEFLDCRKNRIRLSGNHFASRGCGRSRMRQNVPSITRVAAGAFGFLVLSQLFDGRAIFSVFMILPPFKWRAVFLQQVAHF